MTINLKNLRSEGSRGNGVVLGPGDYKVDGVTSVGNDGAGFIANQVTGSFENISAFNNQGDGISINQENYERARLDIQNAFAIPLPIRKDITDRFEYLANSTSDKEGYYSRFMESAAAHATVIPFVISVAKSLAGMDR